MHCVLSISPNLQTKQRLKAFSAHLTDVTWIQSIQNGPFKSKKKHASTKHGGGGQVLQSVTY
jgi:hypothetical protein